MKNILTQAQIVDITRLCHQYKIINYSINNDGSIDVEKEVYLAEKNLTKLPLKFNKVGKTFHCGFNKLTTLEGCPREVGGNFYCNHNQLTSLQGCPDFVRFSFDCDHNSISTLEHCPALLKNGYEFQDNKFPRIVEDQLLYKDNMDNINIFLKYQEHFGVWENGFNAQGFNDLIAEINEGLR